MSVTLTLQELANDMRVGPLDAETQSVLERELAAATILIERRSAACARRNTQSSRQSNCAPFGSTQAECQIAFKFSGCVGHASAIHPNASRALL